ncbi:hypothetical protein SN10_10925 [Vibrio harveyi]|nr:hypothetical protein SN10_10925 [Vibrio harveyi]
MVRIRVYQLWWLTITNLFQHRTKILIFPNMGREQIIFMYIGGTKQHGKVQLVAQQSILVSGKNSYQKYQVA